MRKVGSVASELSFTSQEQREERATSIFQVSLVFQLLLLSLGLRNVIARPTPLLSRSQKRARPLSCATQITVGADDGVVQDVIPDDVALFGAKSADLTSDSDNSSTISVV